MDIINSILQRAPRLKPMLDFEHLILNIEAAIKYYAENEIDSYNLQQGSMKQMVTVYKLMGKDQKVKEAKIRIAESFIEEAEWKKENYPSGNSVAATFYEKALHAYMDIGGFKTKVEELKNKIKEAHAAAFEKEFRMTKIPIEVDKKIIDSHRERYKGRSTLEVFHLLITDPNLIPSFEGAKKATVEHAKKYVLMHLVSQSVIRKNIRVKTYETDDDRFYFFTLQNFMLDYQFKAKFFLVNAYCALKEEHPNWVAEMIKYLKTLPLVKKNRLKLIEKGLSAFEREDYISAIHILVFQIEGILRDTVEGLRIAPFSYHRGEMRIKKLWDILEILQKVEGIDKDILMLVRTSLVDIGGENLRNDLAHGILDYDEFTGLRALILIYILLKITPYDIIRKEKPESDVKQ